MKKLYCTCILLFCFSFVKIYASDPLAIDKVTSFAFNYDGQWTAEYEFDALILSYKDKIVIRSERREGLFIIMGKVEQFTNSNGEEFLTYECVNEDLKACILAFTYSKTLRSRCMYIWYDTHQARYIIKDSY